MRVFTIALFPHPPLIYCSLAITKRWYDVFGAGAGAVAERAEKNLPRLLIINFKLYERDFHKFPCAMHGVMRSHVILLWLGQCLCYAFTSPFYQSNSIIFIWILAAPVIRSHQITGFQIRSIYNGLSFSLSVVCSPFLSLKWVKVLLQKQQVSNIMINSTLRVEWNERTKPGTKHTKLHSHKPY